MSSEFSEANSMVMVGVGDNRAPWRCLVSNNGVVQDVMFTGDDSAGVPGTAARSGAPSTSDVSGAAQQACLSAVSRQTNERNVSVMSSEFSEANSMVMVGVGDNRAPWRCLVSNNGVVQDVMFTGDDSAGVDQSAAPPPANSQSMATTSSEVSDAAVQACRTAVSSETNEGDVAVLSSEFSEANSLVMIGVGAQRAPWRCLVSNDGAVQDVSFAGDEGRL